MAPKKKAPRKREPKAEADQFNYVTCPECGNDQGDMGKDVACEECGEGPMPWHDEDGLLHD